MINGLSLITLFFLLIGVCIVIVIWSMRKVKESPEEYWNNKYPKQVVKYRGRSLPNHGMFDLDVRSFCANINVEDLQVIVKDWKDLSDDEKALECLSWVIDNITYVSDKSQFGLVEYWMFPWETLLTKKGDCDDGAILLENLMRASGIPYWKIRPTAGLVPQGGHAYITYYCKELNHWVALDWCYYPSKKPINQRPDYKESKIYMSVWFSWNERYSFHKGTRIHKLEKKFLNR